MRSRRNVVLGGALAAVIVTMAGVSYAAVPLYRLFCQATGYNGTPNTSAAAAPGAADQVIQVRFDANVSASLPWTFRADSPAMSVAVGTDNLASYTGRNRSTAPVTGVATYNVSPDKAARYFHKTACFCFNAQTLQPGEAQSFPLSFWIDPAIAKDPDTKDVRSVTLSYTFFRSLDDAARNGGLDRAGPHTGVALRGGVPNPGGTLYP